MENLISIDTGVKLGIAIYNFRVELIYYGSHNYGDKNRLKRNIPEILRRYEPVEMIVLEGGGKMAGIWEQEAAKHNIEVFVIQAQQWRELFFNSAASLHSYEAKRKAIELARIVVTSCARKVSWRLSDNTAEAILAGIYAMKLRRKNLVFPPEIEKLMRF